MNPQDAIDLGREAIKACAMVGGPILLASLVIGLLVGIVQAMTQVQDQTVSFVPKLLGMMLVIGLGLPWLADRMVEFSHDTLATPMTHFGARESFGSNPIRAESGLGSERGDSLGASSQAKVGQFQHR
jgi:flagellar biosynthetic protein FliQ